MHTSTSLMDDIKKYIIYKFDFCMRKIDKSRHFFVIAKSLSHENLISFTSSCYVSSKLKRVKYKIDMYLSGQCELNAV